MVGGSSPKRCLDVRRRGLRRGSLEEVGGAACGFDTCLFGFGQLLNVAVHGVLEE